MARATRLVLAAILVASTVVGLSGCADSESHRVDVPALWASPTTGDAGIERATVTVRRDTDGPGLHISLADVEAKGGGPAWLAASASAATVGTLFAGVDPSHLDVSFGITGPIDGPSAGGILTVGVLAAIRDVTLLPGATMTGTISPDGTIGPVAFVGAKMLAARNAGFTDIVLSALNNRLDDPATGHTVEADKWGRELGLNVHYVTSVAEAFDIMTGRPLVTGSGVPATLPANPEFVAATTAASIDALASARAAVELVSNETRPVLDAEVSLAEDAFSRGDSTRAYGLAVDASLRATRINAQTAMRDSLASTSPTVACQQLLASTSQTLADIQSFWHATADMASNGSASQVISTPNAMSWGTEAMAVLTAMRDDLNGNRCADVSTTSMPLGDSLIEDAGILAVYANGARVAWPSAAGIVAALPPDKKNLATTIDRLSGYTNFLVQSGDTNVAYLESVLGAPLDRLGAAPHGSLLGTIVLLRQQASEIHLATEAPSVEVEQAAVAQSYFVVTSAAIAAAQNLGVEVLTLASGTIDDQRGMIRAAVASSAEVVNSYAAKVQVAGLQPGYAVWSSDWASATLADMTGSKLEKDSALLALDELWYDSLTVLMLNAT